MPIYHIHLKYHKMKTYPITLLMCLCVWFIGAQTNNTPTHKSPKNLNPNDYDLVEQYTILETTHTSIPKHLRPEYLSPHDKDVVVPKHEIKHFTNTLDKNGIVQSTIIYERPSHVEKWINYTERTIIYNDKLESFDADGKLLSSTLLDEKQKKEYKDYEKKVKDNGRFQNVSFSELTPFEKQEILKANGKIKKVSATAEEVEYDSLIYRNIPEKFIKQFITKKRDGKKLERPHAASMKYNSMPNGDYFLEKITEVQEKPFVFKDGTMNYGIERNVKSISNYSFLKSEKYTALESRMQESLLLTILTNPVFNGTLDIKITSDKEIIEEINVQVLDTYGRLIVTKKVGRLNPIHIDIASLSPGIYIVKCNKSNKPAKFIKL